MKCMVLILGLFVASGNLASSYKILCAYPTFSRSHFIVADALLTGLAEKGHQVTVISPYPPTTPIPNYRHITHTLSTRNQEIMKNFAANPGKISTMFKIVPFLIETVFHESHSMMANPEVQKLMNEESFDMVIVEVMGELHMGLAAHFKCPVVFISTVRTSFSHLELLGNPLALSYVSHPIYKLPEPLSFGHRLINVLQYVLEKLISGYYRNTMRDFHNQYFPHPQYPTFDEMTKNISAIFAAQHFSQGGVMPLLPNIVEVSGIQMKTKVTPLPDELQQWMDDSTNGVILFSMGSNLNIADLAPEKLKAVLDVFRKIKLNILWKSEISNIPGLPSNVHIEQWISQIGVLQHTNLKLFITHGGLGSVNEAKFYGVPLIVIPIFADQMSNGELVRKEQWGVTLQFSDLNETLLLDAIEEVLLNPKYNEKAKYEAMLYRDRPISPLENGIYWIEYIIRHKGAPHMQSNARRLNFFQLHSLDVLGFLVALVVLSNWMCYKLVQFGWRKIFKSRKHKQS